MPALCAFDIDTSGAAHSVLHTDPMRQNCYRWSHWDLGDEDLLPWAMNTLPEVVVASLMQVETRPRATGFDKGAIVALRGMNLNPGHDDEDMVSLRAWVTENTVVTVRRRKLLAVDDIRKTAETGHAPSTSWALLADMVAGLSIRIQSKSIEMEEATLTFEEQIFESERNMPGVEFAQLRRGVIRIHRYIAPQAQALEDLVHIASENGCTNSAELNELANLMRRNVEEMASTASRLAALFDHTQAQHAYKQGQNSYVLSIIAAIFLPLGFVTGLFGVNVAGMPGLEWPWAFATLCLSLVGMTALAVLILKRFKVW